MADENQDDYIEIKVKETPEVEAPKKEAPKVVTKKKATKKTVKKKVAKKKTVKKRKPAPKEDDSAWLWVVLIIIGLVVIGSVIYLALQQPQEVEEEKKLAALVNNEPIYADEIESIYERLPDNLKVQTEKETILDQLVDQRILLQEADRVGITVTEEELEEFTIELMEFFGMDNTQLDELLEVQGITKEEFDDSNRKQILITKLINESVYQQIEITEEEIQEYYEENIDFFESGETVVVRHILIQAEGNETDEETLARAEEVASLDDDFCDLVEEYSQDVGSLNTCGEYEVQQDGTYVPEFEEAAFTLELGEIDIVKSVFGYHIMEKIEIREAGVQPLEEVSLDIENEIGRQKSTEAVQTFIADLKDQASIEIYPFEDVELQTTPLSEEQEAEHEASMQVEVIDTEPARADNFGECLEELDAQFFGVYWSPDVKEQKDILGDLEDSVEYIECDTQNPPDECEDVSVYPTWYIGDSVLIGKQSLNALSSETGCPL